MEEARTAARLSCIMSYESLRPLISLILCSTIGSHRQRARNIQAYTVVVVGNDTFLIKFLANCPEYASTRNSVDALQKPSLHQSAHAFKLEIEETGCGASHDSYLGLLLESHRSSMPRLNGSEAIGDTLGVENKRLQGSR